MADEKQIIIDGIDVSKCKYHRKCVLPDNIGCKIDDFLCCDKPNCNFKQLARKTQIIDEIEKIIAPYQEQIELDALSLPIAIESILERKTQECKELRDYAQRQENQRETYYKEFVKKDNALEEIEEIAKSFNKNELCFYKEIDECDCCDMGADCNYLRRAKILYIINTVKGDRNEYQRS